MTESREMTSAERKAWKEWRQTVKFCRGYPKCDGNLEGINHSPDCPVESPGRHTDVAWEDVWMAGWQAGRAPLLEPMRELTRMLEAYRLHHKLMLQVTEDTDCPCSICKQVESLLERARKELE